MKGKVAFALLVLLSSPISLNAKLLLDQPPNVPIIEVGSSSVIEKLPTPLLEFIENAKQIGHDVYGKYAPASSTDWRGGKRLGGITEYLERFASACYRLIHPLLTPLKPILLWILNAVIAVSEWLVSHLKSL